MAKLKMIGGDRPVRSCIGCRGEDDHPRHSEQIDPVTWVDWHLDCHSQLRGCEDCAARTAGAEGKTGAQLLEHLTTPATPATDDAKG